MTMFFLMLIEAMNMDKRQARLLAYELRKLNLHCEFDEDYQIVAIETGGPLSEAMQAAVQQTAREVRKLSFSLNKQPVGDRDVEAFLTLPQLEALEFDRFEFSEDGWKKLASMPIRKIHLSCRDSKPNFKALASIPTLEALECYEANLTVEDARYISQAKNLSTLTLRGSNVDDSKFEFLATIPTLTRLKLDSNPITDKHLGALGELKLQYLNIGSTKITDRGLAAIRTISTLEVLYVDMCSDISGKTIASLTGLNQLRKLSLMFTQIDDSSIEALGRLQSLEELSLYGTRLSRNGKKRLIQLLPNCEIDF